VKKRLVLLIIAAALLVGAFFIFRPKPVVVESGEVSRKDLILSVQASGVIATDHQAQIAFLSSGKIGAITVHEGDAVKKGQFLASLDPMELQIAQDKTLANWRNIRFQLDDFNRVHKDEMFKEAVINQRNQLVSLLEASTKDVESADTARRKLAVYSPIDGIVTKINNIDGENVMSGTTIMFVDDLSNARFLADIDESDISKIQIDQQSLVTLDAYSDKEIRGKVTKVALISKTTKSGGTAFESTIVLDSPFVLLRKGLNGDAKIIETAKAQAIVVPNNAVATVGDKHYIYKIEGNKVKKVEVTIGLVTDAETEVISGLSAGDKVITSDQSKLKDGQSVKIK